MTDDRTSSNYSVCLVGARTGSIPLSKEIEQFETGGVVEWSGQQTRSKVFG